VLDRSGDRPAAIRAYDEFTRRLREELDAEPSGETRALVEIVRRRAAAAVPSPGTIGILPFDVRGDARFAYLREGMVDLLATRLDGAGPVRTVDARAILRAGVTDGRAAVERFGVTMYLSGTVVEAGGKLRASATLHAADESVIARVAGEAQDESGLFELVDDLARQLLAAQGVTRGTRLARLAALTTDSLGALKTYLRGEVDLRGGRYFDALEAFQAAVDQDPTFALAYYRLAAAAAGCALPDVARDVADKGFAHRERLSPHDQLVFSAQRAWLHGAVTEAESLYTTITGIYPDDVEAWFHLGDLLFHSNPLRGRSAAEARAPFERVLALEPDHLAAMVHLVRISAIEDREPEMLGLIERVLRVSPDSDQALAMRALHAYRTRDPAAMSRLEEELQHARAITVAIAFADVALYSKNLAGAERLARSFIHVARAPELRALCHILLACVTLADHRVESAWRELALAESHDRAWGLEMRALFATLPSLPTPEHEVRAIREALDEWDPASVSPSSFPLFAMHNDLHPAIRAWLLGLLDLRLGDTAGAEDRAEALEGLVKQGASTAAGLLSELRAATARAKGQPAEALAILEAASPKLWFQLTVASPFLSLASSRRLHAELLEELGRRREASEWRNSLAQRSPYELIHSL
ncbi:MAG TPA: BTAD domain-containing putative transcriptional regulator, partial [Gemmatimonadales bacterium]